MEAFQGDVLFKLKVAKEKLLLFVEWNLKSIKVKFWEGIKLWENSNSKWVWN